MQRLTMVTTHSVVIFPKGRGLVDDARSSVRCDVFISQDSERAFHGPVGLLQAQEVREQRLVGAPGQVPALHLSQYLQGTPHLI